MSPRSPRMVDVSTREPTARRAEATGKIMLSQEAFLKALRGELEKGDVFCCAKLAAINSTKFTSLLMPLCHAISLDAVEVELTPNENDFSITCVSRVSCTEKTGAEMEALFSVAVALLTIYDMCKSIDPAAKISEIRLLAKEGGRSGRVAF